MSRFVAAGLLNACLERISEVSDEIKTLLVEFDKERALLLGRVDGLEAKVWELEASQWAHHHPTLRPGHLRVEGPRSTAVPASW